MVEWSAGSEERGTQITRKENNRFQVAAQGKEDKELGTADIKETSAAAGRKGQTRRYTHMHRKI